MPDISVLFGPTKAQIGLVVFDASLRETHTKNAKVSDHPAEEGSNFSDHIRPQPWEIEINGIVSNTPIAFLASLNAPSPIADDVLTVSDRARAALDELDRIMEDGELVTVVTSLREYENMALQSISARRDAQNGNVLNATMSLKEIVIAELTTTEGPTSGTPPESGGPTQNLGSQSTSPAGPAAGASALQTLVDFGSALIGGG